MCRYLLGNLHDFDPAKNTVPYDKMPSVDKWMLGKLAEVQAEVEDALDNYQFFRASQVLVPNASRFECLLRIESC